MLYHIYHITYHITSCHHIYIVSHHIIYRGHLHICSWKCVSIEPKCNRTEIMLQILPLTSLALFRSLLLKKVFISYVKMRLFIHTSKLSTTSMFTPTITEISGLRRYLLQYHERSGESTVTVSRDLCSSGGCLLLKLSWLYSIVLSRPTYCLLTNFSRKNIRQGIKIKILKNMQKIIWFFASYFYYSVYNLLSCFPSYCFIYEHVWHSSLYLQNY